MGERACEGLGNTRTGKRKRPQQPRVRTEVDLARGRFLSLPTCHPRALRGMRASRPCATGAMPVLAPRAPRGSRPCLPGARPVPAGSTVRARLAGAPPPGGRARRSPAVVVRNAPEGGVTGAEAAGDASASAPPPMSVDLLVDRVNVATQARARANKRIATLEAEVRHTSRRPPVRVEALPCSSEGDMGRP